MEASDRPTHTVHPPIGVRCGLVTFSLILFQVRSKLKTASNDGRKYVAVMIRFSLLPISASFNFINSSVLISAISKARGVAVASLLKRSRPDRAVRGGVLAGDIV